MWTTRGNVPDSESTVNRPKAALQQKGPDMGSKTPPAPPVTNRHLKHLAGEGLSRPSKLTADEVRELAGAVMTRIEPRGKK